MSYIVTSIPTLLSMEFSHRQLYIVKEKIQKHKRVYELQIIAT